MNVKHEVTPTYLVIIPPVGAILNEGLIIEKVQRRMNTDNVFFLILSLLCGFQKTRNSYFGYTKTHPGTCRLK